jgi:hypothetical protein
MNLVMAALQFGCVIVLAWRPAKPSPDVASHRQEETFAMIAPSQPQAKTDMASRANGMTGTTKILTETPGPAAVVRDTLSGVKVYFEIRV